MEYRRDEGVGSVTILFSCCMEGGRDLPLARELVVWALAMPDFGFVARRLFSCSSRASNNAVDLEISRDLVCVQRSFQLTSSDPSSRGSCSSVFSSSSQLTSSADPSEQSLPLLDSRSLDDRVSEPVGLVTS